MTTVCIYVEKLNIMINHGVHEVYNMYYTTCVPILYIMFEKKVILLHPCMYIHRFILSKVVSNAHTLLYSIIENLFTIYSNHRRSALAWRGLQYLLRNHIFYTI